MYVDQCLYTPTMTEFLSVLVIELSAMIYGNQGPKRDLLNGNLGSYQVGNHVFGAQTIEMNEMICCNEKPSTFCEAEKKST